MAINFEPTPTGDESVDVVFRRLQQAMRGQETSRAAASAAAEADATAAAQAAAADAEATATVQAQGLFYQTFEDPIEDDWIDAGTLGTVAYPTNGVVGGKALEATGQVWFAYPGNLPFDPNRLYRMRTRYRQTTPDAGSETIAIGVVGVAADGVTLVNRTGSNNYGNAHYAVSDGSPGAAWVEVTSYFRGTAAAGTNGGATPQTAGQIHENARYIRPVLVANFSGGSGVAEIDYFSIEIITEDPEVDALNTQNAPGEAGADVTANNQAASIFGQPFTDATIASLLSGSAITETQIKDDSITTPKIAANTIVAGHIQAGVITGDKIAANTIEASNIAADTITAAEIAAGVITATQIAAGTITANEIAAATILAANIAAGTITANELAAGSVSATQLQADAVTAGKIAANAVEAGNIAAGAISTSALFVSGVVDSGALAGGLSPAVVAGKIADGAIDGSTLIANGVIVTSHITAGAITTAKIDAGAVTANEIAAGTITANEIAAGTITASEIAALTITAAEIAAGTITGAKIAAGTIEAGNIAAGAITAGKIAVGGVSASTQIADGIVTTAKVDALAITSGKIAAGAIIAGKIAVGGVSASTQIANGVVDTDQLNANAVTAAKIAAGTITANELAAGAITAGKIAVGGVSASTQIANGIVDTAQLAADSVDATKINVTDLSAVSVDISNDLWIPNNKTIKYGTSGGGASPLTKSLFVMHTEFHQRDPAGPPPVTSFGSTSRTMLGVSDDFLIMVGAAVLPENCTITSVIVTGYRENSSQECKFSLWLDDGDGTGTSLINSQEVPAATYATWATRTFTLSQVVTKPIGMRFSLRNVSQTLGSGFASVEFVYESDNLSETI